MPSKRLTIGDRVTTTVFIAWEWVTIVGEIICEPDQVLVSILTDEGKVFCVNRNKIQADDSRL
ncbi:hypothetical protein UFOVP1228_14 [uncultured Caudovirales phage]|uniref:Uncharacterized protein n=1 Tax=uncultured Caudovirales phage TaxID=2100421 RepID=A0A6J5PWA8_9CAUD|nr:hypothetical protein UFOVP956_14 [uncultured Caudovirales phage]CAB4191204.1 hypothetical protein UFOVP1228_14 [uncultured Caudovirales phage]CAB4215433.1 hypothetical protein UFOVP1481_24 [uncultured Caudovirales phage]